MSTVLLGTSRIAAAIDPDIWARTLGTEPPVMLAVEGEGALPALADMANDTSFRGHLVVEMLAIETFSRDAGKSGPLHDYLRAYHESRSSPARQWEAWLRVHVPSHMVFRRIELLPNRLIPRLRGGRGVRPVHYHLREDQFRPIDFRIDNMPPNRPLIMDSAHFAYMRGWGVPVTGARLDSVVARIGGEIARIQQRGGRVTLITFQGCGGRRLMELGLYPKETYWNRLRALPGVQAIDSDDHPDIAGLPCYDGSHIDAAYAPAVTAQVARLVEQTR